MYIACIKSMIFMKVSRLSINQLRTYSIQNKKMKGLLLGVFSNASNEFELSETANKVDTELSGKLQKYLNIVGSGLKKNHVRVFYDISPKFDAIGLVCLPDFSTFDDISENVCLINEAVRSATSAGCRVLQDQGVTSIFVEDFSNAEASAEGSHLGVWKFQELKNKNNIKQIPEICPYEIQDIDNWNSGFTKAEAQNISRRLSDMPANLMTPTRFAQISNELLTPLGIEVKCYEKNWIKEKQMNAFLSVTNGSLEPPVFLEINYRKGKANEKPVVLVGKGITFDSGGICLKSSAQMDEMRADMMGAACIVGTLHAVGKLQLPLNITALIPLCENMPGGKATHPGDVVIAMNGKSVQIDNTDAEGRLVLADALCYAASFNPDTTIDIATLTGAMGTAIGDGATGVFTNSSELFHNMDKAAQHTGDRIWRFPLWKTYSDRMTDYASVDVNNLGKTNKAGACKAAAFLKEFIPAGPWMHMDIAGVMGPTDSTPYLHAGMTGRPTRTIIQYLQNLSK